MQTVPGIHAASLAFRDPKHGVVNDSSQDSPAPPPPRFCEVSLDAAPPLGSLTACAGFHTTTAERGGGDGHRRPTKPDRRVLGLLQNWRASSNV